MALEADVEEPQKSPVFSKNPAFLKNHHVCDFVCDSLRMAITGVDAFDLDQMLDLDLEVHHHDAIEPTTALSTMADSLPGLGIVAAVLGVVITMGALGGRPKKLETKWLPPWLARFSGFCSATAWLVQSLANIDQSGRGGACLSLCAAGADDLVSQGDGAHYGGGSGPARGARPCAAIIQGTRASVP